MNCEICKSKMHRIIDVAKVKVTPGGFVICGSCGTAYQYDQNLNLFLVTEPEISQLLFDNVEAYTIIKKLFTDIDARTKLN